MPIEFTCQNCQKKLKVPDSAAGKRGRCNKCGHLNTIPSIAAAESMADFVAGAANAAAGGAPVPRPSQPTQSNATYNVKSAVNGAVFGPADSATLKEWLDEGRITPNCQLQQAGTQHWVPASQMFPALGAAAGIAASAASASTSADPFAQFQQSQETQTSPADLNPYAPTLRKPTGVSASGSREIVPTAGDIGFCISHGWKVWTENFGLLLAVSATTLGINWVLQIPVNLIQASLGAGNGDQGLLMAGLFLIVLVSLAVQMWLGLGATKLTCNLCRGQRAEYSMLFNNGRRLPMLILVYLVIAIPFLVVLGLGFGAVAALGGAGGNQEFAIVAAVAGLVFFGFVTLFCLTIWPVWYLLSDTDEGLGLVSKSLSIGFKNLLIAIPIFLVATLITMAGLFACIIGVIATAPAGQAMVATAYLNMTGQLKPR